MTGAEIIGLVASIVSLIIGGFAIWLSVTFYKMSNKNAKDLEQASANIDSTVNRLEVLFDKLYSDTFSMMKDTVTDMRNHVWKTSSLDSNGSKTELEENFEELKAELNSKIEELISNQGAATDKVDSFANQIESLISETIDKSAREKVKKSAKEMELAVISAIKEHGELNESQVRDITGLSKNDVTITIFRLGNDERIEWPGGPKGFNSSTKFRLGKNA